VNLNGQKEKPKSFLFGPAILVTAAFIGPGTVTVASKAGAQYGFVLIWAVLFSVMATIVLQEMAGRLGVVTGGGLSRAMSKSLSNPILRWGILALVLLAIFVGNAAYQTGNILGAASGVVALNEIPVENIGESNRSTGSAALATDTSIINQNSLVVIIGVVALVLIWIGRFKVLQIVLTGLVALMSGLFLIAAVRSNPDWSQVANGFVPSIPKDSLWVVVGLIGTTVVPYNLFLHASAAAERWGDSGSASPNETTDVAVGDRIRSSRLDTMLSVLIGGLVTIAILVTASVAFHGVAEKQFGSVKDIAIQLEPALGSWAKTLFAIGLFSAGLTSAITAPIAAAYAASGCFGWSGKLSDWRLKLTATAVVAAGIYFGVLYGKSPKETIILAQAANGLLLPIMAVFLIWILNRADLMGRFKNRMLSNVLGGIVVIVVTVIAFKNLNSVSVKLQDLARPRVSNDVRGDASHFSDSKDSVGDTVGRKFGV
jgi:NRAMP (natural resistance-associated macrophage protein)-like metal ion transporter